VLKKLTNVHLDPEQVLFQYQDMVDLIINCVEVWQREERPIGLEISTQLPRSCWMNFPGVMMTQVILDLLDNAAEAIPESRNGSIQITLTHDESMCSLSVEDNGTGFPLHIKQHLGEPFNTSKTKGNGLGLYHASLLAQLMGGELKIESNDPSGEGTKITIICRKEMHVDR
jgi:signal transduction histidine kinase